MAERTCVSLSWPRSATGERCGRKKARGRVAMQWGRKKVSIVEADTDLLGGTTGLLQKGQSRFQLRPAQAVLGVIVFGLAIYALLLFHHTKEINVDNPHEHHLYETTQELLSVARELNQTHKALLVKRIPEGKGKAADTGQTELIQEDFIQENRAIPGGDKADQLGHQIEGQAKSLSPAGASKEAISKSARGGRLPNDETNEGRRQVGVHCFSFGIWRSTVVDGLFGN